MSVTVPVEEQTRTTPAAEIQGMTASDGYRVTYRHWPACSQPPRGYVVALHGIQSHSGWYDFSCRRLAEAGYDVRFMDRRGSGLNEAQRGHAIHADRLIHDVVQLISEVRHERNLVSPNSPVMLKAVSWGGKLAVMTTVRRPELVDGLLLLYPGICTQKKVNAIKRFLLKTVIELGGAERVANVVLNAPGAFTDRREFQEYIENDPLFLTQATYGLLHASVQLDEMLATAPEKIRCPVMMMLAGRDRIIDNTATKKYFQRFASSDKNLIVYPHACHTLEFEPDRENFLSDLLNEMEKLKKRHC